ncbi:hypothetical protein [Pseudomonas syringae]|uniref:hypothetical protein n=1 Tax=Pseudomonas syringae TaxID=317 RepID=UPI001372EADB|nr:hypothetical protein [Pseudomonas syringae]MDU8430852.1 hypothetical protein [Pseudomonas syringae pv. actinidifoliorum]MDU8525276.1 hypothetical protein [Pseudomonas syringae pv. actinidifoliorum]NAT25132.1 hypothetical protein [Pseudomonas syringae pv. actinidifoliorum]NAT37756.1 hypothetical protein [Pseudomonas syringae pv. actinidifoliorum]
MAEVRTFVNPRTQTFESLKTNLALPKNTKAKFVALNSHISGGVVLPGELVIVGDASTPLSTAQEAFLMVKAAEVHRALLVNGVEADDFFVENFELLKQAISYTSMGVGAASDGWAKHMEVIKKTLQDIEKLYRDHMGSGTMTQRDAFYAKRTELFMKLDKLLNNFLSYGSGLRNEGSIKRMLGLSTNSYMHAGEIPGYADKVSGVAKAAKWIKRGAYIGTALEVGSTGLAIHKACTLGREEQCRKAKYVEGGSLLGSVFGAGAGGYVGGILVTTACVAIGIPTGGMGTLACGVIGGAVGGWGGGEFGESKGEKFGEVLYGKMTND